MNIISFDQALEIFKKKYTDGVLPKGIALLMAKKLYILADDPQKGVLRQLALSADFKENSLLGMALCGCDTDDILDEDDLIGAGWFDGHKGNGEDHLEIFEG